MTFEVSVIIPVYNAAKYVEKAITSAVSQPEVREVIVIDDGSTDDTYSIIQKLSLKFENLILLNHPKRRNKGRSASRNLGIVNAKSEFIAFLDADDYYLKNRFKKDEVLFKEYKDIDGVYNAIGVHFYRSSTKSERQALKLTTFNQEVPSHLLFHKMAPKGTSGRFSGDGLTVKRTIFERVGFFNEDLEVAEDTHMWIKMSLKAKLIPGALNEPVSIRGVHEKNVFTSYGRSLYNRNNFIMFSSLLEWAKKDNQPLKVMEFFWVNMKNLFQLLDEKQEKNYLFVRFSLFWLRNLIKYPVLLKSNLFIESFPGVLILRKMVKKLK